MRWLMCICLALIGCGPSEQPRVSTENQTVESGSADCELVAVDDEGTLPSCAAGTPSEGHPGKPFDDTSGDAGVSLPLSASDVAATAAANALSAARNPTAERVNRGFGPATGGQP